MKFSVPPWLKLMIISVSIGAMLGVVNELTEGLIAQQAVAVANAARQKCFAQADSFEEVELSADSGVDSCYAAMVDGQLAGYVAQVTVTGFGGPMEIHVGMDLDQTVTGVNVGGSDFAEPPGLGAKARDADFTDQFAGLTIPTQLGNGLDAITGATISSETVVDCVNRAVAAAQPYLDPSKATKEACKFPALHDLRHDPAGADSDLQLRGITDRPGK